jgi:hypothetical protein
LTATLLSNSAAMLANIARHDDDDDDDDDGSIPTV